MDGLKRNLVYTEKLLSECDILCIQEHWLLAYEAKELWELFPDHRHMIKCIDDLLPVLPKVRSRAHGGTAILWRDNIDHCIEPQAAGSDRVCAVKVHTTTSTILLINTYMPTQGCANAIYDEILSEVQAIITENSRCIAVWAGDINAATSRNSRPTTNDLKFCKFCEENGLQVSHHTPATSTFHYPDGSSRIDMFVERKGDKTIKGIEVETCAPLNVSPHDPVTASIQAQLPPSTFKPQPSAQVTHKVRWDKVDREQYRESTDIKLSALNANMDGLPTCLIADRLNDILHSCALTACPPPPTRRRKTKFRWSSAFKPMALDANEAFRAYKKAPSNTILHTERLNTLKAAKKVLRKAQRQAAARRRWDINSAITSACHKGDRIQYFKLIKQQRRSHAKPAAIDFGSHASSTPAESWRSYYKHLATPSDDPSFDAEYQRHLHLSYLLRCLTTSKTPLPAVTPSIVSSHVKCLKSNKAADIFGIQSEHIKLASPLIISILTHLTNDALTRGELPDNYKIGCLHPVPKKNKSQKLPTNYRRITITAIIGKVVEAHLRSLSRPKLDSGQSGNQFGFSPGCSPTFAALVITEVMAEAMDTKTPLLLTLMDTSKAFDVVPHESMLNSLHQQGVDGTLWRAYNSMYTNVTSMVKWQGETSASFTEGQGIRQGGISSTDKYKAGKNPLLNRLDRQSINTLGHVNVGAVMVADDLVLTANNKYDMQVAINIAEHDASRERYKFNPDKTKFIAINLPDADLDLQLYDKPLGSSKSEPHLGLYRNSTCTNDETVENKIKAARSCTFSLKNAGYYGLSGTGAQSTILKYRTIVLPTLLYGLEALVLDSSELQPLTAYHRQTLRCIQHIPKSTAVPAIHFLSGVPPIEALLDIRTLTLLRSTLAIDPGNPPLTYIRDLVVRQLAMKDGSSASWACHVKKLLSKYHLPPAGDLASTPPSKDSWKRQVKEAVHSWWTDKLRVEAALKSTLEYLNIDHARTDTLHPVWYDLTCPLSIKKASVKALLLIQRYPLTTSPTAGTRRCDTCPLCGQEPETVIHFVLQCPSLAKPRARHLKPILDTCRHYNIPVDCETLIRIILDSTYLPQLDMEHERRCRNFLFKIHSVRAIKLGGETEYKRF